MSRLMSLGELATEEMLAADAPNPVFDRAAAIAARKAGFSDEEIVDLLGYMPPLLSFEETREVEMNCEPDDRSS